MIRQSTETGAGRTEWRVWFGILWVAVACGWPAPGWAGPDDKDYESAINLPDDGPVIRGGPTFRLSPLPDGGLGLLSGGAVDLAVGDHWSVGVGGIWADGNLDGTEVFYAGLRGGWFQQIGSWFWVTGRLTVGGGTWIDDPPGVGNMQHHPMWVVEPEFLVGVSITPNSRVGVGASYRLAVGPEGAFGTAGRLGLSSPTLTAQVEFGDAPAGDDPMFGEASDDSVYSGLSGFLSVQAVQVAGRPMFLDGAGNRVMFRDRWALGVTGHRGHVVEDEQGRQWRTIYGGILTQRIVAPDRFVHGSGMLIVGLGSTGYLSEDSGEPTMTLHPVAELTGFVEMNLTDYFRLAVGGGYRLSVPLDDRAGLSIRDVSSPVGLVQFRFGAF